MTVRSKDKRRKPLRGAAKLSATLGMIRRPEALVMRLEGKTYAEIGRALGIAEKNAWRYVQQALAEHAEAQEEHVAHVRALQDRRLDALLTYLWSAIQQSDPRAVQVAVAIEKRRAELLGLDAPKKLEHTGKDGAPLLSLEAVRAVVKAATP